MTSPGTRYALAAQALAYAVKMLEDAMVRLGRCPGDARTEEFMSRTDHVYNLLAHLGAEVERHRQTLGDA